MLNHALNKSTLKLLLINIVFWGISTAMLGQNHFVKIWDGENGFGHMNIYVVTALLDDEPLQANDEIAVFSKNFCVGTVKLESEAGAELVNLIASLDDGTGNGFTDGDTIIFKVWDHSDQAEKTVFNVEYRTDLDTWLSDGRYMHNESSFVDLKVQSTEYQNISLKAGWNIFSSNLVSLNPDMAQVMDSLIREGELIKVQDETGQTLENIESLNGWNNGIGDLTNTEGYKIKVLNNCNLSISGNPVITPIDIALKTGWNIVAFPLDYPVDAKDVFQTLIDNGSLDKVKDEKGNSLEDWGIYGGWVNNIGNCEPGEGYEVYVNQDVILTISAQFTKSLEIYSSAAEPAYFSTVYEGNGLNHMNINVLSLAASNIVTNDEIALFDGNNCVGVVKITDDNLAKNVAVINAAAANGNDPGFEEGGLITYKVWKANTGKVLLYGPSYLKGGQTFTSHESSFVRLGTVLSEQPPALGLSVNIYPSPTQGPFRVDVSGATAMCNVEIYDITGQLLEGRTMNSISESFDLSAEKNGVYFVKTSIGESSQVQRIILNH